jgi:hypothetical protein
MISVFSFVATIYLLDHLDDKANWKLFLAILTGICSSFAFGNGLLVWPLGALLLILKRLPKYAYRAAAMPITIWLVAAIITIILFMSSYQVHLGHNPNALTWNLWLHHPLEVLYFFAAYLGSTPAATNEHSNAITQGLVILIACVVTTVLIARRSSNNLQNIAGPFVLILYAILSDCLTLLGRVGSGVSQALAPRYVSISCLGIAGVYIVLLTAQNISTKTRAFMLGALTVPIIFAYTISASTVLSEGAWIHKQQLLLSYVVLAYKKQDKKTLSLLDPECNSNVEKLIPFLERQRLSVFRHGCLHTNKSR